MRASNPERAAIMGVVRRFDVDIRDGQTGKHPFIEVTAGDQIRKIFYPSSGSDHRGPLNAATDARKVLRSIGAKELPEKERASVDVIKEADREVLMFALRQEPKPAQEENGTRYVPDQPGEIAGKSDLSKRYVPRWGTELVAVQVGPDGFMVLPHGVVVLDLATGLMSQFTQDQFKLLFAERPAHIEAPAAPQAAPQCPLPAPPVPADAPAAQVQLELTPPEAQPAKKSEKKDQRGYQMRRTLLALQYLHDVDGADYVRPSAVKKLLGAAGRDESVNLGSGAQLGYVEAAPLSDEEKAATAHNAKFKFRLTDKGRKLIHGIGLHPFYAAGITPPPQLVKAHKAKVQNVSE